MFLNDNFLLSNKPSQTLFHDYAKKMPIIDYHCHLDPQEIYEDKNFKNITEAWLYGDHYKWRLMRANGVDENLITGSASDYEKFLAWCQTVPKAIGNPLYTWSHLELRRFFGIEELICEENAPIIWEKANGKLASKDFSRRQLIIQSNVKIVCTTDDPVDDLHYHQLLKKEETAFKVLPAFRPDKALNIDAATFVPWINALSDRIGKEINSFEQLKAALKDRIQFFTENGGCLSDHALDVLRYEEGSPAEVEAIFQKGLSQETLTDKEVAIYRTELLSALIAFYHEANWTMQLHIHAHRNNNTAMFEKLGPDTGYDSMNDLILATPLKKLLDRAEKQDALPKTILYSLNPNDYPVLVTLMGCYQKEEPGKLQLGSAWWFNDTRAGMREQLTQVADGTLLANFVGMLTDSRSFLSYTRHEYFRRVLCELVGEWIERGELPADMASVGKIIEDISFNNADRFFGFN